MLTIKRLLKKFFPQSLINFVNSFEICCKVKRDKKITDQTIFYLYTPQHGNLGDHAIASAVYELFGAYRDNIIEITGYQLIELLKSKFLTKKLIGKHKIIVNGGGNLGTLWFFPVERRFRRILQLFPDNQIYLFPNTIYYEDSEWGKEEFENSKKIYNSCNNLILTARERTSFDVMKKAYKNVYLIPDMALYLNKCRNGIIRNGVMTILREDLEKTLDDKVKDNVISLLEEYYDDFESSDTQAGYDVMPEDREEELEKKFSLFRQKQLVLTDRLHGMIFSAITGTPCIVLNSKSHKLKGVYDWVLKDCDYLLFSDNPDEIKKFISYIKDKNFVYDNSKIMHYYDELKSLVLS